ncbi:MAG: Acetylxylan esterase precursor, partial [Verrucomicrobiota bacterium]
VLRTSASEFFPRPRNFAQRDTSFRSSSLAVVAVALIALSPESAAQTAPPRPSLFGAKSEIPLYAGVAPGSEKWDYAEIEAQGKSGPQVKNVVRPTLLYFPAAHPVGTAMIVAPGGGTRTLMMSYEGVDIAKKLNEAGVDAFVLKYRLIQTGPGIDATEPAKTGPQAGQNVRELAGLDGRRAVELVRSRADEFKVQPDRIGIIGFSAGGGPIRGAMTGPAAARPDFAVMIYAAGARDTAVTVPAGAPPLFLAVSADDPNYEASITTFLAWRKASVPVELHIFQMGAHGFVNKGGGADHFMDRVGEWMRVNGWLPKRN